VRSLCACAVVLAAYALTAPAADEKRADKGQGFRALDNGRDFTGWKFRVPDPKADPRKAERHAARQATPDGRPANATT
jgi:hypothetical protein